MEVTFDIAKNQHQRSHCHLHIGLLPMGKEVKGNRVFDGRGVFENSRESQQTDKQS